MYSHGILTFTHSTAYCAERVGVAAHGALTRDTPILTLAPILALMCRALTHSTVAHLTVALAGANAVEYVAGNLARRRCYFL